MVILITDIREVNLFEALPTFFVHLEQKNDILNLLHCELHEVLTKMSEKKLTSETLHNIINENEGVFSVDSYAELYDYCETIGITVELFCKEIVQDSPNFHRYASSMKPKILFITLGMAALCHSYMIMGLIHTIITDNHPKRK